MLYDIIIIGGGPAAVAAAVYTARKKLKTLLITESFGGQSMVSDDIQNWIGEKHIGGFDLAKKFEEHVRAFPDMVDIKTQEKVTAVREIACVEPAIPIGAALGQVKDHERYRMCDFEVETDKGNKFTGKSVILTAGARRRKLGVPGEEKFEGKGVAYCSTCLPPEESIVANSSISNIAEIENSQSILTHDGSFQKVIEKMSRDYTGDLIQIKTRFFTEPVVLTPNHPVWAATVTKGNGKNYLRDFKINAPEWIRADQLTRNNVLLYPVISSTHDKEMISLSDFIDIQVENGMAKYRRGSPTAVSIPNKIPVDGDFLRLAGYFIAEGSITGKGINFYFSKHEKEYIEDVKDILKKIFHIETHGRIEGSVMRLEIYSEIIGRFFYFLFGKYAHNKKLPHWMLLLPEKKLAEIIKGIYRGDGCKREKDFCIVTNSRVLAYQLRDMLLKLGIIPSIQRRSKAKLNKRPGNIGGRIIRFNHDKYHISVGGPGLEKMSRVVGLHHEKLDTRKMVCRHAWLQGGYAYLPVRSINRVPYKGEVLNLAVEKNNTYIVKNFVVHNCDAPLFSGKKVAVVGGGNAGLEAVQDLFPYAAEVYLLEFGETVKGDPVTLEDIKKNPKLNRIILNAQSLEVLGDKFVNGLKYKDRKTNEEKILEVGGVFVEIGSVPNSEMVKGLVDLDKYGQVIIDSKHASTSKPGIFAAGDITDDPYKQNNISAGDAVKAALAAYAYLLQKQKMSPAAEVNGRTVVK